MSEGRNPLAVDALLVHEGLVRGLARAVLHGDERVDDVVQDTWVASMRGGPDDPAALRGWLARVARRFALLTRRRDAGRRRVETAAAARPRAVPTPAEIAEREEARRRVLEALLALDAPHREALLLRFYEGLPPREIARRLDVPVETARTRVKRGLERLRERLLADRAHDHRAGLLALAMPPPRISLEGAAVGAGGVIVGKKLAVAIAVLFLLAAGAGLVLSRLPSDDAGRRGAPELASATEGGAAEVPGLPAGPARAAATPQPVTGPRLRGTVVDERGAPIANASVLAMPDSISTAWTAADAAKEGGPGAATTTGSDGRFDLPAREGTGYDLHASAEGRATTLVSRARAGREMRIVLAAPDAFVGRVTNTDLAPVAGARLRLFGLLGAVRYEREATTDAEGAYRLPLAATAPGSRLFGFQVEVRAEGYAVTSVSDLLLPRAGHERRRDFVVARGATFLVRVLDAETGEPLDGARVLLWSVAGTTALPRPAFGFVASPYPALVLADARTGAEGTFAIEHVPARGFDDPAQGGILGQIVAVKDGRAPGLERVTVPDDDDRVEITLRLSPAAVVVGRVRTSDGRPVYPATVSASPQTGVAWNVPAVFGDVPLAAAATDADGRYRIPAAPASRAGTTTTLRARKGRFGDVFMAGAPDATVSVRAGETTTAPDLVIETGVTDLELALRALSPDGRPLADARVGVAGAEFGRTDADGVLRIARSSSNPGTGGPLFLAVRAGGFAPAGALLSPQRPPAAPVDVRLAPPHRLQGRVVSADGTPAPGALVIVADPAADGAVAFPDSIDETNFGLSIEAAARAALSPVHGLTTTDAEGAFALDDLPAGPWQVCASLARGGRWAFPVLRPLRVVRRDVAQDTTDLRLALPKDDAPPAGRAIASVVDAATGKPVVSFQAKLVHGRASVWVAATGPGRVEWDAVPAGRWTLKIDARGYAPGRLGDVEIKAEGPTATPSIALSRGATVVGRLVLAGGAPAAGLEVALVPARGKEPTVRRVTAPVAPDGTFRATGLVEGVYRLQAAPAEWMQFPRPGGQGVNVPKDGTLVEVDDPAAERRLGDVALVSGGQIDVNVVDDRLPPAPIVGYPEATAEQVRFGDSCHVVVTDERGTVLADQRGLWSTGHKGALDPLVVAPGVYVVRLECGSEPVRERRVTASAGALARALFDLR